ncbi:MAG TPA: hypothetical protein VE991_07740 [Acidimicrobiales bacterium]|nr:hypothetical protein [Acidimicrobiales bacterium]
MRARALVAVAAATVLLSSCSSPSRPAHHSRRAATTTTFPFATVPTSTTLPSAVQGLTGGLPVYPFASVAEVQAWQQSYQSSGAQPWHLDAGQSALQFTSFLGFSQIDKVVSTSTGTDGAHVTVGFATGSQTTTSAVIHLVRWGSGTDAPWEVVGTDDTTFSLTTPAYGAKTTSPATVGGRITGTDENIEVRVFGPDSPSALDTYCCMAAGGTDTPWQANVVFRASKGTVLAIVAQTGGHVATVERFTVTAVRAG